jgi:hypothetical protein
MTTDKTDFRSQVLLSVLRALWGMITPDIRAISVTWGGGIVGAMFIYDHPVSEADWEVVREVETSVVADFGADVPTHFAAESIPRGGLPDVPKEGWWVYVRHEGTP